METIKKSLKAWVLVNWKTTVLGVVAAVEIYQHTGSVSAAVTAFVAGLIASDGKASHVAPAA